MQGWLLSLNPSCIDNLALSVSEKTREHNMKIKPKTVNQNFSVVVLKDVFIMIISLDVLETLGNGHISFGRENPALTKYYHARKTLLQVQIKLFFRLRTSLNLFLLITILSIIYLRRIISK